MRRRLRRPRAELQFLHQHLRLLLQANGRPRATCRAASAAASAATSTATATTTATTASKDVALHEKKGRSDQYQESCYTFHVVTYDLL